VTPDDPTAFEAALCANVEAPIADAEGALLI
jgi:hypothetical protein